MPTTKPTTMPELIARVADAEDRSDDAAMAPLLADDFTLVGPAGFVLSRDQFMHRHDGGLRVESVTITEVNVRDYGDSGESAIGIGVQTQSATYNGNPADGRFRVTFIGQRGTAGWQLTGMHLSPMLSGPPATD